MTYSETVTQLVATMLQWVIQAYSGTMCGDHASTSNMFQTIIRQSSINIIKMLFLLILKCIISPYFDCTITTISTCFASIHGIFFLFLLNLISYSWLDIKARYLLVTSYKSELEPINHILFLQELMINETYMAIISNTSPGKACCSVT